MNVVCHKLHTHNCKHACRLLSPLAGIAKVARAVASGKYIHEDAGMSSAFLPTLDTRFILTVLTVRVHARAGVYIYVSPPLSSGERSQCARERLTDYISSQLPCKVKGAKSQHSAIGEQTSLRPFGSSVCRGVLAREERRAHAHTPNTDEKTSVVLGEY